MLCSESLWVVCFSICRSNLARAGGLTCASLAALIPVSLCFLGTVVAQVSRGRGFIHVVRLEHRLRMHLQKKRQLNSSSQSSAPQLLLVRYYQQQPT
jgi:hypothetical protein